MIGQFQHAKREPGKSYTVKDFVALGVPKGQCTDLKRDVRTVWAHKEKQGV